MDRDICLPFQRDEKQRSLHLIKITVLWILKVWVWNATMSKRGLDIKQRCTWSTKTPRRRERWLHTHKIRCLTWFILQNSDGIQPQVGPSEEKLTEIGIYLDTCGVSYSFWSAPRLGPISPDRLHIACRDQNSKRSKLLVNYGAGLFNCAVVFNHRSYTGSLRK